jgi:two-component system alkaline phosphatase synthesis response regulator PhoP
MTKKLILAIDDEKDILKLLQYNLERDGYQVLTAKSGEEGLDIVRAKHPDLIVLDIMLPEMDGLEVCKILRSNKETKHIPILMLTAKTSEVDQIVGLELGASDYISKPFSVKVLSARVKNIFRSLEPKKGDSAVLRSGELLIDKERHSFTVKGKPVTLTKLEFKMLSFLMENRGLVFSREQLLDRVWDGEAFVVDRTVDVHMRSIRLKLGKHRGMIETVRGSGYRFSETPDAG